MDEQVAKILSGADTEGWKTIPVEFGDDMLEIWVPPECVTLNMKRMPCIASSKDEIASSLNNPIGSPTLPEIILPFRILPARYPIKAKTASCCHWLKSLKKPASNGKISLLLLEMACIGPAPLKRESSCMARKSSTITVLSTMTVMICPHRFWLLIPSGIPKYT